MTKALHRSMLVPFLLAFLAHGAGAQERSTVHTAALELQGAGNDETPAKLLSGMGSLHHPIATKSPEAQAFFDQGLTLVYAFNFAEAVRFFRRAAELDPQAAMPFWGLALALGPNYNVSYVSPANEKAASDALQQAAKLAATGPECERDYIQALARRFTSEATPDLPKLAHEYVSAARELMRRYPDDPDAGALYAESLMDLHARQLWSNDGKPSEDTMEIIAVLESVLRQWPDHAGANHYYIHTMEASPYPERALPSAHRLETLVPAAGHLVHMPAHVYVRTGNYAAAVKSNQAAVAADSDYLRDHTFANLAYKLGYAEHNLVFMVYSASMDGEFEAAYRAASELDTEARALIESMPPAEGYIENSILIQVRFARWNEVLALPAPDAKLQGLTFFWHYARGCAFAVAGQAAKAESERDAMEEIYKKLPAGPAFGMMTNSWETMHGMAANSLSARIAVAHGDFAGAVERWQAAISIEDQMRYHEPPDWFYPMRESLGAALLRAGKTMEAEKIFRDDLERNPRNPRSLFGLWKTLEAEHKSADADWVRRSFEQSWKGGELQLRIEDF